MKDNHIGLALLLSSIILGFALLFAADLISETGVKQAREQEAVFYRLQRAVPLQSNQGNDF